MTTTPTSLDVRPADRRGVTNLGWLYSRHSFSFGRYHDPSRMGYHGLRVLNDDIVQPGAGFGEHGHDNMEIFTWVLQGALRHGDSLGSDFVLRPGELQAMTAGSGIRHSEQNASDREPVHFLQIWIEPDCRDVPPRYDQRAFPADGRSGRWQTLAAGGSRAGRDGDDAMPILRDAAIRVADLQPDTEVTLTVDPNRSAYVHVATGDVKLDDRPLHAGDAIATAAAGDHALRALTPAQVLWFDLA